MSSAIERADGLKGLYGELGRTNGELIIRLLSMYKKNPSMSTLITIAGKLPLGYVTSCSIKELLLNDDGSEPTADELIERICDRDQLIERLAGIMKKSMA